MYDAQVLKILTGSHYGSEVGGTDNAAARLVKHFVLKAMSVISPNFGHLKWHHWSAWAAFCRQVFRKQIPHVNILQYPDSSDEAWLGLV